MCEALRMSRAMDAFAKYEPFRLPLLHRGGTLAGTVMWKQDKPHAVPRGPTGGKRCICALNNKDLRSSRAVSHQAGGRRTPEQLGTRGLSVLPTL